MNVAKSSVCEQMTSKTKTMATNPLTQITVNVVAVQNKQGNVKIITS